MSARERASEAWDSQEREHAADVIAAAKPTPTHLLTEYGTVSCPVEGVRSFVDDGECSACGAKVEATR